MTLPTVVHATQAYADAHGGGGGGGGTSGSAAEVSFDPTLESAYTGLTATTVQAAVQQVWELLNSQLNRRLSATTLRLRSPNGTTYQITVGNTGTLTATPVSPDANDALANATVIGGAGGFTLGPNTGDTTDAGDSSDSAAHSIWLTFVPSASGTAEIDTEPSTPVELGGSADTVMTLYSGASGATTVSSLTVVASDDDGGETAGGNPLTSRISHAVTAGQHYYVEIGSIDTSTLVNVAINYSIP